MSVFTLIKNHSQSSSGLHGFECIRISDRSQRSESLSGKSNDWTRKDQTYQGIAVQAFAFRRRTRLIRKKNPLKYKTKHFCQG